MQISTPLTDCGCQHSVVKLPETKHKCFGTLDSTSLGELFYLTGLDADLCVKFQELSDVLGLKDCAGNDISINTPLVTCAAFKDRLCATLQTLLPNGQAIPGETQLVGVDCKTYTIPAGGGPGDEVPNTVTDTSTINFSATGVLGRNISGDVNISDDAGNALIVRVDGLYVEEVPDPLTACQQIGAFPLAGDATPGTVLVGADCQKYILPAPSALTVTDSSAINLTLAANNLQADLVLAPTFIGALTGAGLDLTCADVLACAPPVTVLDSTSIDLTLVGQQLTAAAIISPAPGNALEILPSGLNVNVCNELQDFANGAPAVPGTTMLLGDDCLYHLLPASALDLTVTDTPSVNLTLVADNLSADVILQPGDNILVQNVQGLGVSCEAVQDCAWGINNNFFEYVDAGNTVFFNPSSDIGNGLTLGSDGRPFVSPPGITPLDTNCINLTLVGTQLSADPIIHPDPLNSFQCLAAGMFVMNTCGQIQGFPDVGDLQFQNEVRFVAEVTDPITEEISCVVGTLPFVAPMTVTEVLDTAVLGTGGIYVYNDVGAGGVSLSTPAVGQPVEMYIKNVSPGLLTVTPVAGTIDGAASITLAGTIVGGYPFGADGGETVHLAYSASLARWIIL